MKLPGTASDVLLDRKSKCSYFPYSFTKEFIVKHLVSTWCRGRLVALLEPTVQRGAPVKTKSTRPDKPILGVLSGGRARRLGHTPSQWWLGKALPWNKFQLVSGFVACSSKPLLFMTSSMCYARKCFIELPCLGCRTHM